MKYLKKFNESGDNSISNNDKDIIEDCFADIKDEFSFEKSDNISFDDGLSYRIVLLARSHFRQITESHNGVVEIILKVGSYSCKFMDFKKLKLMIEEFESRVKNFGYKLISNIDTRFGECFYNATVYLKKENIK